MATDRGIAGVLAYLHELFPTREITTATGAAWLDNFSDTPDDVLLRAAQVCGRDPSRTFFPTAGEVRANIPRAPEPPQVSATDILRQIEGMGAYHNGWQWPRVEAVRTKLGDAVAMAYGEVGPHRLNSDSSTTREIAQRDFANALRSAQDEAAHQLSLTSGPAPKLLHD